MLKIPALIKELELKQGDIVADLGSSIGQFSLPIAKAVGDKGSVYAVDIHRDILTRLAHDAQDDKITNVQTIWGNIETPGGTHIAAASVDMAIFANVLFQVHDRPAALREAMRIVKSGGRIVIIEWSPDHVLGPKKEKRVPQDEIRRLCERFGLQFVKNVGNGATHYGIIFSKIAN